MGCWSHKIMGGDTALDVLGRFAKVLDVKVISMGALETGSLDKTWNGYLFRPDVVHAGVQRLQDEARRLVAEDGWPSDVTWQVLAVLLMRYGAPIDAMLREKLLLSCDTDIWASEGEKDRVEEIARLRAAIAAYDGTPVDIDDDPGLFATIERAGEPLGQR